MNKQILDRPNLIWLVAMLSIIFVACGPSSSSLPGTQAPSPISQDTVSMSGSASYITATSIENLTKNSQLIVMGRVTLISDTLNLARDISDISKPDPNIL